MCEVHGKNIISHALAMKNVLTNKKKVLFRMKNGLEG